MDKYGSSIGKKYETYIVNLAKEIPCVNARRATADEDYRYKADVVINYRDKNFYIQVSAQPKSKKESQTLMKRGIFSVSVNKFKNIKKTETDIKSELESIIKSNNK
jgi:hypothetical protein